MAHLRKPRDCQACGQSYRPNDYRQRTCDRWCGLFVKYGRWPSTQILWCSCGVASARGAKRRCECHKRTAEPRISGSCRVFVSQCRSCSQWFCSPYTVSTCSEPCAKAKAGADKRAGKDRRRALQRGAFVERVYRRRVFERDGWRCHLCGKQVKRDAVVPHPLAPTLDHVIPLAVGGLHEASNCRTAHYLCNSRKGARRGGEQLLLIA